MEKTTENQMETGGIWGFTFKQRQAAYDRLGGVDAFTTLQSQRSCTTAAYWSRVALSKSTSMLNNRP